MNNSSTHSFCDIEKLRQELFSFQALPPRDKWTKENDFLMAVVKINSRDVVDLVFDYANPKNGQQPIDREQKNVTRRYFSFLCQLKQPFAAELALYGAEKFGHLPNDILTSIVSHNIGQKETLLALLPKFSQQDIDHAFATVLFSEYPNKTAFFVLYDALPLERIEEFYRIITEDKAIYQTLNPLISAFLDKAKADIDRGFLLDHLSAANASKTSKPPRVI